MAPIPPNDVSEIRGREGLRRERSILASARAPRARRPHARDDRLGTVGDDGGLLFEAIPRISSFSAADNNRGILSLPIDALTAGRIGVFNDVIRASDGQTIDRVTARADFASADGALFSVDIAIEDPTATLLGPRAIVGGVHFTQFSEGVDQADFSVSVAGTEVLTARGAVQIFALPEPASALLLLLALGPAAGRARRRRATGLPGQPGPVTRQGLGRRSQL